VLETICGSVHWPLASKSYLLCGFFFLLFAAIKFLCDMNYMRLNGGVEGKITRSRTIKQMRRQLRIVYKLQFYGKPRMMKKQVS